MSRVYKVVLDVWHALLKCTDMLNRQDPSRRQHCHLNISITHICIQLNTFLHAYGKLHYLPASEYSNIHSSHRHFSLAESNVTAHQSVHRPTFI